MDNFKPYAKSKVKTCIQAIAVGCTALILVACQQEKKPRDEFALGDISGTHVMGYYNTTAPGDIQVSDTFRSVDRKPTVNLYARNEMPAVKTHGKLG